MKIYTKDVEKIGFKGSGIFESKWHQFYYASVPKRRRVYIINSIEPDQCISHFNLTSKEWKEFNNGELSLIPIGCCCATGNKCKENPIVDFVGEFDDRFKTKEKMLAFVKKLMK